MKRGMIVAIFLIGIHSAALSQDGPLSCAQVDAIKIRCDVVADEVTIEDVTYNRGRCQSHNEVLTKLAEWASKENFLQGSLPSSMIKEQLIDEILSKKLPKKFRFGDQFESKTDINCNLLEFRITADGKIWIFQRN